MRDLRARRKQRENLQAFLPGMPHPVWDRSSLLCHPERIPCGDRPSFQLTFPDPHQQSVGQRLFQQSSSPTRTRLPLNFVVMRGGKIQ